MIWPSARSGVALKFTMRAPGKRAFSASTTIAEDVAAGRLSAVRLGPDAMERRLGLIYRKDKALSKAAMGFIQVILDKAGAREMELARSGTGPL